MNVSEINAGWKCHINSFDITKEGQSFVDTLHFIRQLKHQATAIKSSCCDWLIHSVPSADRAVSNLSTSAMAAGESLDKSKLEEGAVVLRNLELFCIDCTKIMDDNTQLQNDVVNEVSKAKPHAKKWVAGIELDITRQSTQYYDDVRKQNVCCLQQLHQQIMDHHSEKCVAAAQAADAVSSNAAEGGASALAGAASNVMDLMMWLSNTKTRAVASNRVALEAEQAKDLWRERFRLWSER